jgi:dTDP-4-dehydrorhamnose 3,5-epimerase
MKNIEGIKIIDSSFFKDKRGYIWTSWKRNKKLTLNFNHDKFSVSRKNVLRGLHGDKKTWKLISCVFGKIFFVVVNYDKNSKQFLRYSSFVLSHKQNRQILVPPKFLNGFFCLSKYCVLHYKLNYLGRYFDVNKQISVKWNCKKINIKWPKNKNIILSARDK